MSSFFYHCYETGLALESQSLFALLWLFATSGFAWYARNIANYNVMYGSISAVIALLVWMYVMAFIALVGCEFNAEYERGSR